MWFVKNGSQELGPFSSNELKALVKNGHIRSESLVKKSESSTWYQATRVKGLFGKTTAQTATPTANRFARATQSQEDDMADAIGSNRSKWSFPDALERYRNLSPGCRIFALIALACFLLTFLVPLIGLILGAVFMVLVVISFFERKQIESGHKPSQQELPTLRSWLGFDSISHRLGRSDVTHAMWILAPALVLCAQSMAVLGAMSLIGNVKEQSAIAAEIEK